MKVRTGFCLFGETKFIHQQGDIPHLNCTPGSFHRKRSPADCQASATPKNASKGEIQPKHFFGLKLIDKTIFCKDSLSKE